MKKCFVIAPLGKKGTLTRKRSDQIFEKIIKPALETCGYEPVRADKIPTSGVITLEIIEHLLKDDLAIADLTERNPNVTYELGIRHAFRKPVIQIKDESDKRLPFDVQGIRTIEFDYRFAENWEYCKNQIIDFIKNIEANTANVQSPISLAATIPAFGKDEAQSQFNAEILSQLQAIKSQVEGIDQMISNEFGYVSTPDESPEEYYEPPEEPGEPPEEPGEPPEEDKSDEER